MSKTIPRLVFSLIVVTVALHSSVARADTWWDFIQVTCVPELNYFSLHTLSVDKGQFSKDQDDLTKRLKTLDAQHDFISPWILLKEPYTCVLPADREAQTESRTFTVKVSNYREPRPSGQCGGVESFDIVVELNGSQIDSFPAFGINRCVSPESHSVEIDSFFLQSCAVPKDKAGGGLCKRTNLRTMKTL